MKKIILKFIICLCCFGIIAGMFCSCRKNSEVSDSNADNTVATSVFEDKSDEKSTDNNDDKTTKSDETTKPGETTTNNENESKQDKNNDKTDNNSSSDNKNTTKQNKNISLTSGLNSTDVSEVLTYYKLVANKNADLKMKSTLSNLTLNVGTLIIDGESDSPNREKGLNFFKKGADLALKAAGAKVPFPGAPSNIKTTDWISAKAVNDGTYTTVTVKVKPQTDSYNGKEYDGSVGRSMQVLSGFDTAVNKINEFPVISITADFANSNVKIEYQNPIILIKVLNSTGELVKDCCKWSYKTKIYLNYLDATMKVTKNHTVTIKNSNGSVDYSVDY